MLEIVDEIASTSEALKARAAGGVREAALLARRQTAGRGRLGRNWATIEGNLHLSVLLRPGMAIRPGHLSSLAAVALAGALLPFAPGLRLKWPNDVLLPVAGQMGKLAGILLEAGDDDGPWLVIGFGVNLAGAPEGLGRSTASLEGVVGPDAFAPLLLAELARWRDVYARAGYGPVRDAWLRLGPEVGTPLVAGAVQGGFAGLDDDGALLLDAPSGRVVVTSGEVGVAC